METKVAPIINEVLVRRLIPLRAVAGDQGAEPRRDWDCKGYGCPGGSLALFGLVAMEIARIDSSFATFFGVHNGLAMGSIYIDGIGRAEAEVAAADGSLGEDRLLRPDRAARGFRRVRRPDDDGEARGRHLGPQRPEDSGSATLPGATSRSSGRATSPTTRSRASSSRTRPRPASASTRSRTRSRSRSSRTAMITLKDVRVPEENHLQGGKSFRDTARGAEDDAVSRRVGGDGMRDGRLRARTRSTPRSVCSSASRSARSSSSRTCSPG